MNIKYIGKRHIVLSGLYLFLYSQASFGIIKGDLDSLLLVANAYKDNIERLETWQGKAIIHTNQSENNDTGDYSKWTNEVEFLHDNESASTRWYWKQIDGIKEKDGVLYTSDNYFTSGIATPNNYYRLYEVPLVENRSPGTVVIDPRSSHQKNLSGWGEEFSPMYYFKCIDTNWYTRLNFYYNEANNPKISEGYVEREGDIVTFKTVSKDGNINFHKFDLSKSGCLVECMSSNKTATIKWEFEYEKTGGLWVPHKVHYHNNNHERNDKDEKTVLFMENIINEPISPKEFTLDKLCLIPGDLICDNVKGVSWKYKEPESMLSSKQNIYTGLGILGIFVLLIASVYYLKKKRV